MMPSSENKRFGKIDSKATNSMLAAIRAIMAQFKIYDALLSEKAPNIIHSDPHGLARGVVRFYVNMSGRICGTY